MNSRPLNKIQYVPFYPSFDGDAPKTPGYVSHPQMLSLLMGQSHDRDSPTAQSSLCSSIETSGYCSGSYPVFLPLESFSISSKYTVLFVLKLGHVVLCIIIVVAGI